MADSKARRHIVVGTAGHVDHGKTALVRALTGTDCDRLPEEKARGITIELGFARWNIAPDLDASVIDVPGHERFVGTMVAGASGIDCVVMVVAADDGVMPQTREHLAISELLGVRTGVIAVTKCDLATDDLVELVEDDIREGARGTFLEKAEIVRCSAVAGRGLDALRDAVRRVTSERSGVPARDMPAFVAIDRVFTRTGAGTVVTGTLVRGRLAVGEDVDLVSDRDGSVSTLRVRGVEVHGESRNEAHAPTRVALNLRGDAADAIRRGSVVVTKGSAMPTSAVHAQIHLDDDAALDGREVQIHLGTSAIAGTVRLLDDGVALVRARRPFATYAGQRFVLRRSSRKGNVTIGGGIVRDPHPRPRQRGVARPTFFFQAPTPRERMAALVADARHLGIARAEIEQRASWSDDKVACLSELAKTGTIVVSDGRYFDAALLVAPKTALVDLVRELHRERPLVTGFAGAELATRMLARHRLLVPLALAALAEEKALVVDGGDLYRAKEHQTEGERAQVLDRVHACFKSAGLAPPTDDVAAAHVDLPLHAFKDATAELRRRGLLRLIGGFNFDTAALASLRASVGRWFESHPTLAPTEFKKLGGELTRKHAIPLLEWLDQERVTLRKGDTRTRAP